MKKNVYTTFLIFFLGFSCAPSVSVTGSGKPSLINNSTFLLTEISTDKSYGLDQKNPVKVGGIKSSEGPLNERRFLNALAGPNGEQVYYTRSGSCCAFKTKNGFDGVGLLDNYRVTWKGSKDTVSIYINMYDMAALKAPYGFTIKE